MASLRVSASFAPNRSARAPAPPRRANVRRSPLMVKAVAAPESNLLSPIQYLADAAAQIFKRVDDGSVEDWKGTPFTGRISHHENRGRGRRSGGAVRRVVSSTGASQAIQQFGASTIPGTLTHLFNANFSNSSDDGPESFGGPTGFSGKLSRRDRRHRF